MRKRPPTLRPLREALRWVKAASGRLAIGFPSTASRVNDWIPVKAVSGIERSRLKPRSRTWSRKEVE